MALHHHRGMAPHHQRDVVHHRPKDMVGGPSRPPTLCIPPLGTPPPHPVLPVTLRSLLQSSLVTLQCLLTSLRLHREPRQPPSPPSSRQRLPRLDTAHFVT